MAHWRNAFFRARRADAARPSSTSEIKNHVMPPRHRTVLLTAAAVVLFSYGILWGLPNLVDFAQDSLVPVGALAERGADAWRDS